ncbi:hypothetical protein A2693_04580 [Candidatus Curtissbacteria bacterium RIFCSPHIGHO2_01_FULL_40_12]|uniref:Membrane protein 6-pyruvoyl-tetrahydropterin synthase-related domain-containing protein n=1 Tax=Candidatus Curtissbacteria bacterium RIFCSPHIGHO2_01_FULL_40_12 TaxID=1797710 RepID=A0A1F5GA09_9BACT|nr:MAG: hypothetical protein A2693_04580 [Candidatus Curtissbacteria bacterium RIFCSPHIGHO2_01_FULL_40_12]
MKKSSFKFAPVILVCLMVFSFFLPKLLNGKVPIPADSLLGLYHPWRDLSTDNYLPGKFPVKNPLITDPVLQTYPWRYLVISNFKNFQMPLWNPYSFSGQPLLGNIQSSPFQIFNLLFFIMPFRLAWPTQIILVPIFTGLFMYLFLRSCMLSKLASFFGALILPFTGFFMVWLTWGTVTTAALWLPLILLSVNNFFKSRSTLWLALLAFATSQTVFAGHWQTAFYVFLLTGLYLFFKFFQTSKKDLLVASLIVIFLALAGTAIQVVPSLEFINNSARNVDQSYSPGREDWFVPLKQLVQIIAPDYFGNPTTYNYWGVWNYAEFVSYIGIAPFIFAIVSFFIKRNRLAVFFIAVTIGAILFALKNPISIVPYKYNFPLLSSMQPSRILFIFSFSLAVLASLGFDRFLKNFKSKQMFLSVLPVLLLIISLLVYTVLFNDNFSRVNDINTFKVALRNIIPSSVVTFAFIVLILLQVFLKISKKIIIFAIFLLTITELFRFGYKFTPFSKLTWIFPDTQTTKFLSSIARPFRVITTDRRILNGSTSAVYKLENVAGYDPLFLKDYGQLITVWDSGKITKPGSFNRFVTPQKYNHKIANFLNAKYIVTFDTLDDQGFEKVHQEGETKIYENKNALPRAFFVKEVIKADNRDKELEKLIDKNFDLTNSAVSSEFSFDRQEFTGKVDFTKYDDQSFKLKVSLDKTAPLIVSNPYYPGWEALVDNQIAQIKRVNYMFQSIIIPEGEHGVEFHFRPSSFYNGLLISLGSVISLTIFLVIWKRKYQ